MKRFNSIIILIIITILLAFFYTCTTQNSGSSSDGDDDDDDDNGGGSNTVTFLIYNNSDTGAGNPVSKMVSYDWTNFNEETTDFPYTVYPGDSCTFSLSAIASGDFNLYFQGPTLSTQYWDWYELYYPGGDVTVVLGIDTTDTYITTSTSGGNRIYADYVSTP